MKIARIAFIVVVTLLVVLSIVAFKLDKNRIMADRYCQMYRVWVEWDKSPQANGMFGPIASMEARCSDTWLAWARRKTEWDVPWR